MEEENKTTADLAEENTPKEENAEQPNPGVVDLSQNVEESKVDDVNGDYSGSKKNYDNAYFNPIRYRYDSTTTIEDEMDKSNDAFNKKVSTSRFIDILSISLMAVAFVGVILVTMLNKDSNLAWLTWLVLGIAIAIIVASFILTTVFNKKNARIAKDYLGEYEDMLNGYVISDLHVDNPTLCVDAEIDDQEIIQAHYYKTINRINSRALVEGKRNGFPFTLAEVAVTIPLTSLETVNKKPENYINFDGSNYVPSGFTTTTGTQEVDVKDMTLVDMELTDNSAQDAKKKNDQKKTLANRSNDTSTGLFGKYYSYGSPVSSDESIIVCFTGSERNTVLPNYLTGFKAVKVPSLKNNIVVYCINPKEAEKFFDVEGCRILNDISINDTVQSMFISINSYGSKIGMFLSDEIMQLSFKKVKHGNCYETYKDATDKGFAFIDYVAGKSQK